MCFGGRRGFSSFWFLFSGVKVVICVGEGRVVLAEVVVEGRGEVFKVDVKETVEGFEDVYG